MNVTVVNKAGVFLSAFPTVRRVYKTVHKRLLGPSFTWVTSEDIKPCRFQSSQRTREALGVGGHVSPGSQGVYGVGTFRDCIEPSPWDLMGTMSAPNIPSFLGSPESSCKREKWLLYLWCKQVQRMAMSSA